MTPVNLKSDNSGWEETTEQNWHYSYNNKEGTSEWANAVVKEGETITGYFVWIPRYAYKIRYYNESAHTTLVGYSDSRGIVNSDGSIITEGTGRINAGDNFIVHPCFTENVNVGGWGSNIQGIWVAKYEVSGTTTSLKVMPGVESLRGTSSAELPIGIMYTAARSYGSTSLGSHLMKNSEWGACCYLSYSKYGLGWKTKVTQNTNSRFITGGSNTEKEIYTTNKERSTTGNAYGAYDMVGASYEYVSSYVNNGNDNLTTNGNSFAKKDKNQAVSDKFVTVYKASNSDSSSSSDNQQLNYNLSEENMFGDAAYETSTSYSDNTGSWQGACAIFPYGSTPFFVRGGYYTNSYAGAFGFNNNYGNSDSKYSFRPVLAF